MIPRSRWTDTECWELILLAKSLLRGVGIEGETRVIESNNMRYSLHVKRPMTEREIHWVWRWGNDD